MIVKERLIIKPSERVKLMKINFLAADKNNFRLGRKEKIKYLVLHYTAGDSDTAKNNAKYFANGARGASAHYFVDEKEIWQSVREEDTAWHCGGKKYYHNECRNDNSIGIEMCSYKDNNGYHIAQETEDRAILLIRELMKKHNISAENVVRHYDVTHKNCPAPLVEEAAWQEFKRKLTEKQTKSKEVLELTIDVKGAEVTVEAVNVDDVNFIRLRDLPKLAPELKVEYDEVAKRPLIR